MAAVINKGGVFWVVVDGKGRGSFPMMIDANWFAMALLKEGLVSSVTLISGLEIR